MITIALDAMGGDIGVSATVPAAVDAVRGHDDLSLILVGDEALVRAELERLGAGKDSRLSVRHTTQTVGMDEPPAQALRMKKDSSISPTCAMASLRISMKAPTRLPTSVS